MIEENGQSRIYLGIHWAFDKTAGIECGTRVADWVFENHLRPRTTGGSLTVAGSDLGSHPAAAPAPPAVVTSAAPAGPGTGEAAPAPAEPAPAARPAAPNPSAGRTVTPAPAAGEDGLALDALPVPHGAV